MCLEGAWAELTVKVTSGTAFQSAAHGEKKNLFVVLLVRSSNKFFLLWVIAYSAKTAQYDKKEKADGFGYFYIETICLFWLKRRWWDSNPRTGL